MLSSLGSGALPGAHYFNHRGSMKNHNMSAHKGLSVRVFKGPTLASNPYTAPAKFNDGYRSISNSVSRQSWGGDYPFGPEAPRALVMTRDTSKRSSFYPSASSADPQTHERQRLGPFPSYDIRPTTSQDTYIYERSLSSKSDIHSGSESSAADANSTQDSPSSVATELSTALSIDTSATCQSVELTLNSSTDSSPRTPIQVEPIPAHTSTSPRAHLANKNADMMPTIPFPSYPAATTPKSSSPSRNPPSPPKSDSSNSTITSGEESSMEGRKARPRTTSRNERHRDSTQLYPPAPVYLQPRLNAFGEWQEAGSVQTKPDLGYFDQPGSQHSRNHNERLSSYHKQGSGDSFSGVPLPHPPGLESYSNTQGGGAPPRLVPQRRRSDGDHTARVPVMLDEEDLVRPSSAPPVRCVRWCENLIAPSPILSCQRRKGWYNRRGDQLWTNEGAYKPPAPGMEYPIDLNDYPEYGHGWQNEEGVRIDMRHRLIPKQPLRSALKSPKDRIGYTPSAWYPAFPT